VISVPVIETERLILRSPQESDFEPLAAFYASARSATVGGPLSRELAWRALAQEVGHWQLRGFGRWTVTERATGAAVGIVGLWHPEGFPERELGWDLFDGAQGKGYATEAGSAARDHAFKTLGWDTLISLVKIGNDASAAVAQRLGAVAEDTFTHGRFGTMTIYRHPKVIS